MTAIAYAIIFSNCQPNVDMFSTHSVYYISALVIREMYFLAGAAAIFLMALTKPSYHSLWAITIAISAIATVYAADQPTAVKALLLPNEDPTPAKVRQARDAIFDSLGSVDTPTVENTDSNAPPAAISVTRRPMEELPHDLSDAIVVGIVTNVQPFLSTNRRTIYTEFTISITETLKRKNDSTSSQIAFDEPGGAVQLPNGKVVRHEVRGYGDWPEVGKRYTFFLMYNRYTDSYRLLKSWGFKDGKSVPMAVDDKVRLQRAESRYSGINEEAFRSSIISQSK